jgi:hypothetical protein
MIWFYFYSTRMSKGRPPSYEVRTFHLR